jgi:hypothetical protein
MVGRVPEDLSSGPPEPRVPSPDAEIRGSAAPFWDPRILRKYWLDAWSQAFDGYLRSTAFLELMEHAQRTMAAPRELEALEGGRPDNEHKSAPSLMEGDSHR